MLLSDEIQRIISGTGTVTKGSAIQAISNYLRKSKEANKSTEEKEFIKEQESEIIIQFARENNLLNNYINEERYLSEGAEQKVYLVEDNIHVRKLNDAIFYLTWSDYFTSLLLHNYFFPTTAYQLIGFAIKDRLYAVVEQPYIEALESTNEKNVSDFMMSNGFSNVKNYDYINKDLGIILEDLHDENVLTANGILYFIDTVFYLK